MRLPNLPENRQQRWSTVECGVPAGVSADSRTITGSRGSMKKFALLVYNDTELFNVLPAADYESQMRYCLTHADELRAARQLYDSQMLEDAHTARAVRVRNGRLSITDGPFAETKELL